MVKKDFKSYAFVLEFTSFSEAEREYQVVLLRTMNGQVIDILDKLDNVPDSVRSAINTIEDMNRR